ncbi:MAG: hypothetical protein HWN66_16630 [Candidatus Helarchaeota archaeon]|nr:hypothetical protein [Candidatus Helarchaeota archaeon]
MPKYNVYDKETKLSRIITAPNKEVALHLALKAKGKFGVFHITKIKDHK